MIVHVPTPLRSYTADQAQVEAEGATLAALLLDLDRRHPGFRFRIVDEMDALRAHIKLFVNGKQTEDLNAALVARDEIHVICALSGG